MTWISINPLDYSFGGDDIDGFAKKYMQEINAIYSLLNRLRKLDASGNNNVTDAEAYQLKVDTSDLTNQKLLIRNGDNSDWIMLGKIAENFGYDPASIGAVSNQKGAKDISVGTVADRPTAGSEGSLYFALEGELSYFTAGAWKTILTMDITKLINFDKVITKDMTSTKKAAGKIPVADDSGKIDVDITGSAEKLSDIRLDQSAKGDGRVLVYYAATNAFAFADPGTLPGGGSVVGVITPRENLKPYSVGEMVYTSRLPSGKFLSCVIAGTSGNEQPNYSSPTNGLIVDGDASWRIDSMKGINTQVSDSEVLNQNNGDILLQTGADSDDGNKYVTLKLKTGATYKKLYVEPDNRSLIESVGYGVISGLQVNQQAIPDMTVRVEYGVVHMPSGKRFELSTVPSIIINQADKTGVRNDLVYISPTGTISYAAGTLSTTAVAGRRTYTVMANFADGNTVKLGVVALTAGTQFVVGIDIATTVQNIANALLANTTVTNLYNVTSDAVSFTLTEKVAGGLNTPPMASYTGAGTINNGAATNSAVATFIDPVCPSNAVSLAKIVVKANDIAINADNIIDIRNFNSSVKTAILNSTVDGGSYVASGLKVVDVSGFNITIGAGKARINGKGIETPMKSITLTARKAGLMYLDSAGNIGKVDCADPVSFIDDNTIGLWVFNQTVAGANVQNSAAGKSANAVDNDLVPHGGIASVDGWGDNSLKIDGTTGYFSGSNLTNFPTGVAEREHNFLFTVNKINTITQYLFTYGQGNSTTSLNLVIDVNGQLSIITNGTGYGTNFYVAVGQTYWLTVQCDGNYAYVYINGVQVYKGVLTLATALAQELRIGVAYDMTDYSYITCHFFEIRNKMRSSAQLGMIANSLMLPCFYDKVGAIAPVIPNEYSQYHEYLFSETSGTTIADSNTVSPILGTATGTTVVESEIGLTKARKFNGTSDKITCGSFACGNKFTYIGVINIRAYQACALWSNRSTASGSPGNIVSFDSNGLLYLYNGVTGYRLLSTPLPLGSPFFLAVTVNGTTATVYINGQKMAAVTVALMSNIANPAFLGGESASGYFVGAMNYVMFGNFEMTQNEVNSYYNALMATGRRNIIDDVIPSGAISLGFIRTNNTKVVEYNDADYKYGRREKAFGGNRKVFLGWKYFSGSTPLKWDNPFGTGKVRREFRFAQDARGANEVATYSRFDSGNANYGIGPCAEQTGCNDTLNITARTYGGWATNSDGVSCTSGYIGCYAECLEDHKGVDGQ